MYRGAMFSTIVTSSLNGAQLCAVLAVVIFLVCMVWAVVTQSFYNALIAFGLALAAGALLWGLPG